MSYKTVLNSECSAYAATKVVMSDMILMDAMKGLAVIPGGDTPLEKEIKIERIKFYGETPADDCPEGGPCMCKDKFAVMANGPWVGTKDLHPTMPAAHPVYKQKTDGGWQQYTEINDCTFIGFESGKSKCGARSTMFARSPQASDLISVQNVNRAKLVDVDRDGIFYNEVPP